MSLYESIFILRPSLSDDDTNKLIDKMKGVLEKSGGTLLKQENWGKKKTAFEVKKHFRAIFIRVHYLGDVKMVAELERNIRMTDDVLK